MFQIYISYTFSNPVNRPRLLLLLLVPILYLYVYLHPKCDRGDIGSNSLNVMQIYQHGTSFVFVKCGPNVLCDLTWLVKGHKCIPSDPRGVI